MPIISLIAAVDKNNAIGKNGDMLCYLPSDLSRFKSITTGHSVIMGRKTFDSLPNGALPNRRNIIISGNRNLEIKNCEISNSLFQAINLCYSEQELFIIGGGEIYKEAINVADKLYITHIQNIFRDADTFFPIINHKNWKKIHQEFIKADENNRFDHIFTIYEKSK